MTTEDIGFGPVDPDRLRRHLARWYALHRRDLPWRRTDDPYRIWVSEVMLQQTQVATVIDYYQRFVDRFATVAHLADARLQTVLKLWEGLGYYSRARHLHRAARQVVADHGGKVPDTWEAIRQLYGVGDYIAAAVLSIAFGKPHAVVDGNVKRVLARLLAEDEPVNRPAGHKVYQRLADRLLDRRRPGDHNQAVMELGALVCKPRSPICGKCPVSFGCRAFNAGQVNRYPVHLARRKVPTRTMAAAVIMKHGKALVVRRPAGGLLGGLWEFPGGPVADGRRPEKMLPEIVADQVNLRIRVGRQVADIRHAYTHFKVRLKLFEALLESGRVYLRGPAAFQWIQPDRIADLPLPKAMHKCLWAMGLG